MIEGDLSKCTVHQVPEVTWSLVYLFRLAVVMYCNLLYLLAERSEWSFLTFSRWKKGGCSEVFVWIVFVVGSCVMLVWCGGTTPIEKQQESRWESQMGSRNTLTSLTGSDGTSSNTIPYIMSVIHNIALEPPRFAPDCVSWNCISWPSFRELWAFLLCLFWFKSTRANIRSTCTNTSRRKLSVPRALFSNECTVFCLLPSPIIVSAIIS